jgi:hypothetical protein
MLPLGESALVLFGETRLCSHISKPLVTIVSSPIISIVVTAFAADFVAPPQALKPKLIYLR